MSVDRLRTELAVHGQEHLLAFWPQLSDTERRRLLDTLERLDVAGATEIFRRANAALERIADSLTAAHIAPIPPENFASQIATDATALAAYRRKGLEAVAAGQVAVLLMAGGQGTRLGVSYPKGMYSVGLPSGKTLFRLQAERIRRLERLAGDKNPIVWYIMTSGATNETTKKYLEANDYFGLDRDNVMLFEQGLLPCFDFDGKIIMEAAGKVAQAPDGNGGIYRALRLNRVLDDMRKRGILYLHAHSVDNILTKVADPTFMGYCIQKGADCGAKVVRKSRPDEPVGVVCQVDGRVQVVEYSEMPVELTEQRTTDNELIYAAGNICNHFFTQQFLEKVANNYDDQMKLHVAKKKIPYANCDGNTIKPTVVNGIKIEKFVFDAFEFSERFVTWEVTRSEEFSALKNSDEIGKDCPKTARNDLLDLHKTLITNAGGQIKDGIDVEISPLLSYAGENLEDNVNGTVYEHTTVLRGEGEKEDIIL